jgi:putative heme transporter
MTSKRIKIIVNVITILALGVLIYFSWPQIVHGLKEIVGAKISVILLIIPLQLVNYYTIAKLYQEYFKVSGQNLPMRLMYKVALELNFVNHVLPSGGVAGFSYLGLRLRGQGIPVSRTTLAQTMRFGMTFLSFLIILFFGMFLLSFGSGKNGGGIALFIGLSIAFSTLFAVIVVSYIISSEARIKSLTGFLPKIANRLLKGIAKKNIINVERIDRLFSDLHKDYVIIKRDWRQLKKPFLWALGINATEIGTIYLAYVALGQLVNPGAVILAYSVASFAGLISILPGGIGVYEALMTAILATAGVPKALALSATLIYRITCIIVFIPIGFILYQLVLRRGEVRKSDSGKAGNCTNAN